MDYGNAAIRSPAQRAHCEISGRRDLRASGSQGVGVSVGAGLTGAEFVGAGVDMGAGDCMGSVT